MIQRDNEQLFIYNNCIPLVVGFVVGLFFLALCFLFMMIQKDLAWWHILVGVVGMICSLGYLVLNVMGWHKKIKRLPVAYCDSEYLYCLHLSQWRVAIEHIESIELLEHRGGKSIHAVLHGGERKTLISPASFVSDIRGVYDALIEQLSLYGGSRNEAFR